MIKAVLVTMTAHIDVDFGDGTTDPMECVKEHIAQWIQEEEPASFVDAVVDSFTMTRVEPPCE